MPDGRIIWVASEEQAAKVRAANPGANVQVRPAKKKSAETPEQKAARQKANRAAKEQNIAREQVAREQAAQQNARKPSALHRLSGVKFPGGRVGAGAPLVALAGSGGYAAGRVNKAVDKDTAKRTALGAGGTYGAYIGGGYAANVATRALSRKDSVSNNAMRIHRERLGLPSGGFAGNADPKKIEEFYRTLPPEVKFSGTRRLLARTHGAGRFGRLAVPVLAAGGVGGAAYDQGKKRVSKGLPSALRDPNFHPKTWANRDDFINRLRTASEKGKAASETFNNPHRGQATIGRLNKGRNAKSSARESLNNGIEGVNALREKTYSRVIGGKVREYENKAKDIKTGTPSTFKDSGVGKAFVEGLVDKSNIREFPYLPENIREWTAVPDFVRRNPVSPLEMLSTGMLMARAQSASRGMNLDRRVVRRAGKNLVSYGEARMGFNVPLSRGSMMT